MDFKKLVTNKNRGGNREEPLKKQIIRSWIRTLLLAFAIIIAIIFISIYSLNNYSRHGERHILPDLTGMTIAQASIATDTMALRFDVIDSLYVESAAPGAIIDQYPKAGSAVKSGRRVTISTNISSPRKVTIPYVTGFSLRQAQSTLQREGILVDSLIYVKDIATNNVLKQEYKGKEITKDSELSVPLYSSVTLYVGLSNTAPVLRVPLVVGQKYNSVKGMLAQEGLNSSIVPDSTVNKNSLWSAMVYAQSPHPDNSVAYGQTITLYITNSEKKASSYLTAIEQTKQLIEISETELDELIVKSKNEVPIYSTYRLLYSVPKQMRERTDLSVIQLRELYTTINNGLRANELELAIDSLINQRINLYNGGAIGK